MTDMDIINNIADEPIRPPEFVSLERIINEIPYMSITNPTAFYLYLHYNDAYLTDEEKAQTERAIYKLKCERDAVSNKNIEYLERWKKPNENQVIE
tara:strand:- start:329 stop:616 length:288 start_codon:yes stop_codon:yes gene_type:complete